MLQLIKNKSFLPRSIYQFRRQSSAVERCFVTKKAVKPGVTRASTFDTEIFMTSQLALFGVRAAGESFWLAQSVKRHSLLPSLFAGCSHFDTANIFVCTSRKVKNKHWNWSRLLASFRFTVEIICCRRCFILSQLLILCHVIAAYLFGFFFASLCC